MEVSCNKKKGQSKKILCYDIILIAGLLVLSLVSLLLIFILRREGNTVEVELDGRIIAEYSLQIDGEYSLNGGSNILVIKDGEAYLSYADCPDRICVKTGKIKYTGQNITCRPNKITVTVRGNDKNQVDFVS